MQGNKKGNLPSIVDGNFSKSSEKLPDNLFVPPKNRPVRVVFFCRSNSNAKKKPKI